MICDSVRYLTPVRYRRDTARAMALTVVRAGTANSAVPIPPHHEDPPTTMARPEIQDAVKRLQALLEQDDQSSSPALSALWPVYFETEARHLDSSERSAWAWRELRLREGADGVALENRPALTVTTDIVEEVRRTLRSTVSRRGKVYSAATVNRHLIVLRRMLNWAHETRRIPYNPLASLAMEPEKNIRKGKLRTEDELQRLLAHCTPYVKAIVLVLFDGGLRKSELFNMRRDQVFPKPTGGAILELSAEETKTDEPRRPHLTRRSYEALEALPNNGVYYFTRKDGKRYCPRYLYERFRIACIAAGFDKIQGDTITLHSLRHSFDYVRRVRDKWPARLTMKQGGWKTNICEMRYGSSDDDELTEAMEPVDERLSGVVRIGPRPSLAVHEEKENVTSSKK